MMKWFGALAIAALGAASPALAGDGAVRKVDVRPVLYAGPAGYGLVPRQFSWDDGYYSYRGSGIEVRNGRACFDYDRSYPYEFADLPPDSEFEGELDRAEARPSSCEDAPVRNGRGRDATVRICRN